MFKQLLKRLPIQKYQRARHLAETYTPIHISKQNKKWLERLARNSSFSFFEETSSPNEEELSWVKWIKSQTALHNRNNVTRTNAYYNFYSQYPELHWSLLAHMVSRNAGWHMTDLAGELLPNLMTQSERVRHYQFLENCNALIFQDAYPQLLLYHFSRKTRKNRFHLLRHFSISSFMKPIWDRFYEDHDSVLITLALIINEQNYIEQRVVQNDYFKKGILSSLLFRLQLPLQLNQVYFPYAKDQIAGLIMEQFRSLDERIECGKKLYCILFGFPDIHRGVTAFCEHVRHTGSRSDYNSKKYTPSLEKEKNKIYSPFLTDVWIDSSVTVKDRSDWFYDAKVFKYFKKLEPPLVLDMKEEADFSLKKIQTAVKIKKSLRTRG